MVNVSKVIAIRAIKALVKVITVMVNPIKVTRKNIKVMFKFIKVMVKANTSRPPWSCSRASKTRSRPLKPSWPWSRQGGIKIITGMMKGAIKAI